MSDVVQRDAFFDLSGQLVGTQFNADTLIHVVNHLSDGPNGKRCSFCHASPMRQTQVVWAENTRRDNGRIVILSSAALRVAPPRRPPRPVRSVPAENARWIISMIVFLSALSMGAFVVLCCAGFAFQSPDSRSQGGNIAIFGILSAAWIALAFVGSVALWHTYRSGEKRRAILLRDSEIRFAQDMQRYMQLIVQDGRLFEQWRQSWFCMSCGRVVVEQPKPSGSP